MRALWKKNGITVLLLLAGVVFLLLFPVLGDDLYLLTVFSIALMYSVYAASWDLLSGYTGKENFGHAALVAIGAYSLGIISQSTPLQPILSIPLAGILSIVWGILIGIPTLRLKGPYFALATLAVASIMEKLTLSFSEVTGGEEGLYGIPFLAQDFVPSYYFVLLFAILSIGFLFFLGRSNFGLTLKSIRSDEDAARAVGISTTRYKVTAFAISAGFAGMTGAISGHYYGFVGFDMVFPLSLNIIILSVVGGLGGILPAALGAFFLTYLTELLREFGEFNQLIYTGILMVVVLVLPHGVFNLLGDFLRRGRKHGVAGR